MITPQATGRLVNRDDGLYMVVDRIFAAPIENVWASLTRPDRTEAWLGSWTGSPATGAARFRLWNAPESEWHDVTILEYEAPHRLTVDVGESDHVRIYVHVTEAGGHTTVTVGRRIHSARAEAAVGVTLDYYLDRLIAARAGRPLPSWDAYYPALLPRYQALADEL